MPPNQNHVLKFTCASAIVTEILNGWGIYVEKMVAFIVIIFLHLIQSFERLVGLIIVQRQVQKCRILIFQTPVFETELGKGGANDNLDDKKPENNIHSRGSVKVRLGQNEFMKSSIFQIKNSKT